MRRSTQYRMDYEAECPFGRHFEMDLSVYLKDKVVLDLGCFTGGRAIAWHKLYGIKTTRGVDVDPVFIRAANRFSEALGIDAQFSVGYGEQLPFDKGTFDAILSYDVIEHVADVRKTLAECDRVLRPGGVLIAVFPPFFNPTEHHLGYVTRTPALHWFFHTAALNQAYGETIRERRLRSPWYRDKRDTMQPWEKLFSINGTTVREFKRIVAAQGWEYMYLGLPLWPTTTRFFYKRPLLGTLSRPFAFLTGLPALQELLTDRICVILRKTARI